MLDLNKICVKLENYSCQTHNKNPKATVNGDTIDILTCCDEFQNKMIKKLELELIKQIGDGFEDIITGF